MGLDEHQDHALSSRLERVRHARRDQRRAPPHRRVERDGQLSVERPHQLHRVVRMARRRAPGSGEHHDTGLHEQPSAPRRSLRHRRSVPHARTRPAYRRRMSDSKRNALVTVAVIVLVTGAILLWHFVLDPWLAKHRT
jgi:hypothetical protein